MIKRKMVFVLMLATMIWALGAASGEARTTIKTPKIKIGGQEFTRGEIIADFLNIAFSETLWNQDTGDFETFLNHFPGSSLKKDHVYDRYPWLADYIFHPNGWPRSDVINKWTGEITIGIGWPPYMTEKQIESRKDIPGWREDHIFGLAKFFPDSYPIIEEQIKGLVPWLEEATGLPVRYIPRDDPKEMDIEGYARIRIVPIWHTNLRNFFKTLRWGPNDPSPAVGVINQHYEWTLWGGIPFSPNFRSQVDGYILPNPDNSIGLVICKILPDVGDELLRALITECLARALGLPDVSQTSDKTALGYWNKAYDRVSKLPSLDGRKEALFYDFGLGSKEKGRVFMPELIDRDRLPDKFKPYDQLMMSLLYCPLIKSGMDKNQALQILMSNDECVSKLLKPITESIH